MNKDELRWVRIFDPMIIPREYIDQIKCKDFTADRFYAYQRHICVDDDGRCNKCNLLFALCWKNAVAGFCWMTIDAFTNSLVIQTYSIDQEFWCGGESVELIQKLALQIKDGAKLDRVYWITRCPRHSEKYGFKRSRHTLMEYVGNGKDDHGSTRKANGSSSTDDKRTAGLSETTSNGCGSTSAGDISTITAAV